MNRRWQTAPGRRAAAGVLAAAALFLLPGAAPLPAAVSPSGGLTGTWSTVGPLSLEQRILFHRKTGLDMVDMPGWSITMPRTGEAPDIYRDRRYLAERYAAGGLLVSGTVRAAEMLLRRGGRFGGYLEEHPDRYQWVYEWVTVESGGERTRIPLPERADRSRGLSYWHVRDVTGLTEGPLDFELLRRRRQVSDWQLDDDGHLSFPSRPGRTYTAFIPCIEKRGLVGLVPFDSQQYVAERLDEYLGQYTPAGRYARLWAQDLFSMGNYAGQGTWADCSPAMQALFRERTGLEFDPELVQLDPRYWRAWTAFKAAVVSEAAAPVLEVYRRHGVKGSYYIGDDTFSGCPSSLGEAGLGYFWGNQGGYVHQWTSTFWGGWRDRPAYGQAYWLRHRDEPADYPGWRGSNIFRGAVNQALPDVLWWGMSSCYGAPAAAHVRRLHDLNWRYRFVYRLLRQYRQDFIAEAALPSLGPAYYVPALDTLFGQFENTTGAGYLWDTPVRWRHLDLADLAAGRIPSEVNLILLPSEPFMSGLLDSAAVARLREWVAAGNALLVLRAATFTDIEGRDRAHAPIRALTGVDYRSTAGQPQARWQAAAPHWVTAGLPETFTPAPLSGRYQFNRSARWFRGGRQWRLLASLLPAWDHYPASGASRHLDDVTVLYEKGDRVMVAIREIGAGRVAYVAREYGLDADGFGRRLFQRLVHWLADREEALAPQRDTHAFDAGLYHHEDGARLVVSFNATGATRTDRLRLPETGPAAGEHFTVLALDLADPLASGFLENPDGDILWTARQLAADGWPVRLDHLQTGLHLVSPAAGPPLLTTHARFDPRDGVRAFSSLKTAFRSWQRHIEEDGSTRHQVAVDLLDDPPYRLDLHYLARPPAEQRPGQPPWQEICFGPEGLIIHLPPEHHLELYARGQLAVERHAGETTARLPHWQARYDDAAQTLRITIGDD